MKRSRKTRGQDHSYVVRTINEMLSTPVDDMIVIDELSRSSDFVAYVTAASFVQYHNRFAHFVPTTDLPK